MKNKVMSVIALSALLITGCGSKEPAKSGYTQITQEEAQEMMQLEDMHIIIDVRTQEEFNSGHIPGAICIPNETSCYLVNISISENGNLSYTLVE